jgi:hypothetical protein
MTDDRSGSEFCYAAGHSRIQNYLEERFMKRILLASLAVAALALATTPVFAQALVCGNGTLVDWTPFSLQWQGYTTQSGVSVPWVGTGTISFNELGDVWASYTSSVNGVIYTDQSARGTFKVNKNCTGTITFTSGDAAGFTASFVITFGGEYNIGTDTTPGDTMTFYFEELDNYNFEDEGASARHALKRH